MAELPGKKPRRRLNYDKCQFCRNAKKAPQKCDRCIELEFDCSENSRAAGAPPVVTPQPVSQAIEGTHIQKWHDLSLRVVWLKRLMSYQKSIEAVMDSQERLFRCSSTLHDSAKSRSIIIQREECSLHTALMDESTSSNPLAALLALSLGTPDHTKYSSREIVEDLLKSGDIGAALSMQECLLLKEHSESNGEIDAVGLQKYCDIYVDMTNRLKVISEDDIPVVPPLHQLLVRTRGEVKFSFNEAQNYLIAMSDYLGRSLLHVALDIGAKEDIVRSILSDITLITPDDWGRRPIHIASLGNSEAVVNYFIEKGVDLSTEDKEGRSALAYASATGNETIVRLLLAQGIDIDHLGACDRNRFQTPLTLAASNGCTAVVKLLLEMAADVERNKPLLSASIEGHSAVVQLLLEKNVTIDIGEALGRAVEKGHTAVVQLLLEKGVKIDMEEPLSLAIINGHTDIANLLLEKDPNVDMEEALVLAVMNGRTDIAEVLLEMGVDIDYQDPWCDTPLLAAVKFGHADLVQLLLKYGADPSIDNEDGLTPLEAAMNRGHQEIARMLEIAVLPSFFGELESATLS